MIPRRTGSHRSSARRRRAGVIGEPPTQLAITTQPSSTGTVGQAFAQQPVVQLKDAEGNNVRRSGVPVTVELVP